VDRHGTQPEPGRIRVLYLSIFDPKVFHPTLLLSCPEPPCRR
jgi:hypothetical protein